MKKHKKIRWIALVCCLLLLLVGQTTAFAAVPYELEASLPSGSGVHLTYTAGDTKQKDLVISIKGVNTNDLDKVTFSFSGSYFNVVDAVANNQKGTINDKVVTFEKIELKTTTGADGNEILEPATQDVTVIFKVTGNQTKATLEPQKETVNVTYSGSNQIKSVDVLVEVEPAEIEISQTNLTVDYEQYHTQYLEDGKLVATVIAKFVDKYGNSSNKWGTNNSAYLAAEGVAGFAEIKKTSGDGVFSKIEDASTTGNFYEANTTSGSQMVFQVKGDVGAKYTFFTGLGEKGIDNGQIVKTLFPGGQKKAIDFKVAQLNITGINVNTHNEGQIKIDFKLPNYDLTGKKVEVKLPDGFTTKEDQENGRLLLPGNGSLFANVLTVPREGIYTYGNTDGGYTLYIDDEEYMLTNYDGCQIQVETAGLGVLIDNELDFRHGADGGVASAPSELTFTLSGMDIEQVDEIEFKLGESVLASECTNSAEMKFKDDGSANYTYVDERTVVVSGQFEETQTFTFLVEYGDRDAIVEGLNEVYPIEIVTRKSSGDLVEKSNNVKLRYRVTDKVIDISQTEFSDFRTVSVTGNQCAVELTMKINEPELNGRGVYLWITDGNGNVMDVKDRFDIQLIGNAANELFLMNTELAAVEGSSKGDRDVFRIFKKGADTNVSSIEEEGPNLGIEEMKFQITSALEGSFCLNIATGRTAQEALANVKTTKHIKSDVFTFIQKRDLPIISIRNVGDIYYNYKDAGLVNPGPGLIEIEIDNIEFPEDPTVPDNLYIKLPEALVLYEAGHEKYGQFNEGGYLKLNQNNALEPDESTGKKHYRWQVPLQEIKTSLMTEEQWKAGEERLIDGSEFTYKRGMSAEKSQEVKVDISSTLVFKSFVANLYQFLQASFGTPAYPAEDISLTIAAQETIYKSDSFNNSTGILFWFSNGNESILTAEQVKVKKTTTDAEGKTNTEELLACTDETLVTKGQNKFVLEWFEDEDGNIQPGKLAETLAVQFAAKGKYQLNIALTFPSDAAIMPVDAEADGDEEVDAAPVINPAADVSLPNTTTTMYVQVEVTEKDAEPDDSEENETWNLALTVDGTAYTATKHVYTISGKKIGEKIALAGILTDKAGNPLVGVDVAVSGTDWTYTGTTTAVTSDKGEFAFEISADTEGEHLLTLTLKSPEEKYNIDTKYSLKITLTDGTVEETDGEYTVDKVKVVSTVAVDDMAVVYLDVYDKDDNRIQITSNSQARGIFKEIEFRDLPDRSDLYDSNIGVRASNGGIEVYFYPDYRGDYYIRMITNSGDGQVINASFEAVIQGDIVDIQLIYPEKTLGIGQTSSPAQIITYDKNGVEAEVAIVKSGWDYYYQGSAAQSMDEWGRVTLKDNERYIGSTVSATVYHARSGLTSTYTFNVDDNSYVGEEDSLGISGIVIENDYGAVGETNQYQFYLVDRSGFTVELAEGQMSSSNGAEAEVTVYSKPYGANVNAYISSNGQSLEDNGFGYLYVDCDKEGTVRLNIRLKIYSPKTVNNYTYNQYEYYSKTIELQMKKNANPNQAISTDKTHNQNGNKHNTSVAIFLGTNHYRVNMNEKIGDATPYIQEGRIMVPLRTLTDGLGANFEENQETQTITIKLDGNWAKVTFGSNIIKTNYGSIYSDIMPVVKGGCTYLPLRTAAEVLGCEVEAVSNVSGETIGAIFLY